MDLNFRCMQSNRFGNEDLKKFILARTAIKDNKYWMQWRLDRPMQCGMDVWECKVALIAHDGVVFFMVVPDGTNNDGMGEGY